MRPLSNFYHILSENELDILHEKVIALLEDPGMKIENLEMLSALKRNGAIVDFKREVAKIPKIFVEKVIEKAASEEKDRILSAKKKLENSKIEYDNLGPSKIEETAYENQLTFSWHTPFKDQNPKIQASFGGGAPLYYDHGLKKNRYATRKDFLRMVHLAEGIPEVLSVGNPLHYIKEDDGTDVSPKMVAIKGASMVAKHSSKPGCTSIIDKRQLPYLMEIGMIVKGSAKEYMKNPIFVNIHDTESPLRLTRPEAAIIEDMVKKNLSIFILPMPLMGISAPIFSASGVIMGAAEILGVWAAAKALNFDNPVEARCVSGVLNPSTGAANFATPQTVLTDIAVAQLFRHRYHVPCGTGIGNIDSPVPGALSIFERTFKAMSSALAGEPSFPLGIIGGAVVYSMEQAILDLDIANFQYQYTKGIDGMQFEESLELIREKGIGGLFIDTHHTASNFRDNLTFTRAIKNIKGTDVKEAMGQDPVENAHKKCLEILSEVKTYQIEDDKLKAIDDLVEKASKELSSIRGAMI